MANTLECPDSQPSAVIMLLRAYSRRVRTCMLYVMPLHINYTAMSKATDMPVVAYLSDTKKVTIQEKKKKGFTF